MDDWVLDVGVTSEVTPSRSTFVLSFRHRIKDVGPGTGGQTDGADLGSGHNKGRSPVPDLPGPAEKARDGSQFRRAGAKMRKDEELD